MVSPRCPLADQAERSIYSPGGLTSHDELATTHQTAPVSACASESMRIGTASRPLIDRWPETMWVSDGLGGPRSCARRDVHPVPMPTPNDSFGLSAPNAPTGSSSTMNATFDPYCRPTSITATGRGRTEASTCSLLRDRGHDALSPTSDLIGRRDQPGGSFTSTPRNRSGPIPTLNGLGCRPRSDSIEPLSHPSPQEPDC